jgi:hypothetical protein
MATTVIKAVITIDHGLEGWQLQPNLISEMAAAW